MARPYATQPPDPARYLRTGQVAEDHDPGRREHGADRRGGDPVKAAWIGTTVCLHLEGTEAPRVEAHWVGDEYVSLSFESGAVVQSISFRGTPQEIRLALAKGLAAVNRAVKEREVAERAELAAADALEEPAEAFR